VPPTSLCRQGNGLVGINGKGRIQERRKRYEERSREVLGDTDPHQSKSRRKRWQGKKQIFEEDTQHGELEKYNKRGWHEGSVDPDTGEIIKGPVRGRFH